VVLSTVQNNGKALMFASEDLKANEEIAFAATLQHKGAIDYVDDSMQQDVRLFMNGDIDAFQDAEVKRQLRVLRKLELWSKYRPYNVDKVECVVAWENASTIRAICIRNLFFIVVL